MATVYWPDEVLHAMNEQLADYLMSLDEFRDVARISDSTERRYRQSTYWPAHIHVGVRRVYYIRAEVAKWLESRCSAEDLLDVLRDPPCPRCTGAEHSTSTSPQGESAIVN